MAWIIDENMEMLQFQVPKAFKKRLKLLAKMDGRSVPKECIFLMKEGIRRRESRMSNDFPWDRTERRMQERRSG